MVLSKRFGMAMVCLTLVGGCDGEEKGHQRMVELLKEIARNSGEHRYLGNGPARRLRAELAVLPADAPAAKRARISYKLGEAELLLGNEREAIAHLTVAYQLLPTVRTDPEDAAQLIFYLGVAYIRLGETENCCVRKSPDACILPIRGGGVHRQTEGSERAIQFFTEVLSRPPSRSYLGSLWLLNIAYMTLGRHPDDVPSRYLIPPKAFESEENFPRFVNIASRLGIDTFSQCGGAVVDDFDNDGRLDLFVSSWEPEGQIRLFLNHGDGKFSDRTERAGLVGIYGGLNLMQADYDNDGDVDVFVLRGAWLRAAGRHPNSLLRNNGDGTFTDVTFEAGLGEVHYPTQTAAWADYDNDGDVDVYVGNEAQGDDKFPCQLFRNNGDGTFTDVAKQAGVTNEGYTKAVVWGDYDNDRDPDLYVSNLLEHNRLYRNNGDGTFTDVARALGVDEPRRSFPAWFWDFDNDGALDLFVAAYSARIESLALAYQGGAFEQTHLPRLYKGDGRGAFKNVGPDRNLVRPNAPMGCNFGDLDNDGYLDFYLGTGYPEYEELMPNVMYHNREGKSFADVTSVGGFGHLQKGHAVAFADLDDDGDQDVFEQMGGALAGDGFWDALYENPGFGNHFITVRLVGVRSNRSAIGARIRVDVVEKGRRRTIYKHTNSGGTFGANPLRQTIGLGKAEKIERLEVFWPTTGESQAFTGVPLDEFIQIVEGEARYSLLSH